MDKINKEIEELATTMEKSMIDPSIKLFSIIKSLGPEGLKERLPELTEDEKVVLKSALEQMTLQKAVSFDAEAQAVKYVQGNIMDTKIQEDKADDDADEKLVKPEAAKMSHQGTPTDGWEGQVIKSEIEILEENLDEIIEKAMAKVNDSEKVASKLKEKGLGSDKVQGAIEKYKLAKSKLEVKPEEVIEEVVKSTTEEIKVEHIEKSIEWEDENRLLKANTQGRNFTFNVENFIEETLREHSENIKKSTSDTVETNNVNDTIEKSEDKSATQVNLEKANSEHKTNGAVFKSFQDNELAQILGLTEEEAKLILG